MLGQDRLPQSSLSLSTAVSSAGSNPVSNEWCSCVDVPLPNSVYAVLYCYLTEAHRLHAVTAELYRGNAIVAKAAPSHVGALTERVINLYLRNVLDAFSTHLNTLIALFRDKVELPLSRHACPVAHCPLGSLSNGGLSGGD